MASSSIWSGDPFAITVISNLVFSETQDFRVSPAMWHSDAMEIETVTLWRPVGHKELELMEASNMRAFPPRLPDQPISYPVLTESYAMKIARDWNAPRGGGYVTRFRVKRTFLINYNVQSAGGREHLEYWIPAEDLQAFNAAIVGQIEVIAEFPSVTNQTFKPSSLS